MAGVRKGGVKFGLMKGCILLLAWHGQLVLCGWLHFFRGGDTTVMHFLGGVLRRWRDL